MIVYKVVYKHPAAYKSSNVRVFPYSLIYRIGERTSAPRGTIGVFVFKTLPAARWYARNVKSFRTVLKVKTDKRYIKEPIFVCGWLQHQHFPIKNQGSWAMYPPEGTLTVPSVIPIKEMSM